MSEVEIRDELKDQGVAGVPRVTLKEGKVIPTNTLFLTFVSPELPKEITVGYLKVKVALFVPNPMCCFNCNKSGHTSQRCKVAAKCPGCGKDKHEGRCEGPKLCSNCNGRHASSAKDCPVWQKEKEIQRVRVEKRISFPEARQLVEAKMPTVVSGGKSFRCCRCRFHQERSEKCRVSDVDDEFVFFRSNSSIFSTFLWRAGRPGSVSVRTQASSGRSRPASADARVLCDPAKSSETVKSSADPSKTASEGSVVPSKTGPKGSAGPLKTALKGSAGFV